MMLRFHCNRRWLVALAMFTLTSCSATSDSKVAATEADTPSQKLAKLKETYTQDTSTTTTRLNTLADMRQKYTSPQSQFIDVDGINVHYIDEGKGPVLLLTHGTFGDLYDWDIWAAELKNHFRVIRFDVPGFGLTGEIKNQNYSIERIHVLIDGLMDELGAEKFAIAGISYGGMVAFRYAATRTDRVTAMILINSAGIQTGKSSKRKTKDDKPRKNLFIAKEIYKPDVEQFYLDYINDQTHVTDDYIQRKLDYLNIAGRLEISYKSYGLYEKGNPQRVLAHVKAPSLVVWGTGNEALDTTTAQAFIDALVNTCSKELVTLDNGGHYINVERPVATMKIAKSFLLGLSDSKCASFME